MKRLKDIAGIERQDNNVGVFSVVYQHLKEEMPVYLLTNITEKELEYLYSVGHKLFQARQYEKALKIFIYLGMMNKHDGRFLLAIGLCYVNLKRYSEATIAFLQLKQNFGEDIDPHVNMHLAECFSVLRHDIGVIECLKEAVKFYTGKQQYASFLKTAEEMLASYDGREISEETSEDDAEAMRRAFFAGDEEDKENSAENQE